MSGKPKIEWPSQAGDHTFMTTTMRREDQQDSELVEHRRWGTREGLQGQGQVTSEELEWSASLQPRIQDREGTGVSPPIPPKSPVWHAWPSGTRTKPGARLHGHALDVSGVIHYPSSARGRERGARLIPTLRGRSQGSSLDLCQFGCLY